MLRARQDGKHFADDMFKYIILNKNCCILTEIEICSQWCNWQYSIIGSDNGLAPVMWQAIIWTSDGLVYAWHIYVSLGLNESKSLSVKGAYHDVKPFLWNSKESVFLCKPLNGNFKDLCW